MDTSNKLDYILQHITSLLTRDTDQVLLEQLGIGYAQYKLLRVLFDEVPKKQRFIANSLGQTEASISRQIDILIDKQLVTKTTDPNNKRVRLVLITSKGKNIVSATHTVMNRYHTSLLSDFPEKQQLELLKRLDYLHDSICKHGHDSESDYVDYLTNN